MRIGMVTQWYDPEGSSAALPGVISRALSRAGHDVQVLTGLPNYPNGEIFPGYRVRPYAREVIAGVTVHRSPLYASHDDRASRRAANYLSFATGASAVAVSRLPRVDAVLVHGTPATAAIPALVLQVLKGTPFIYHIQDLWPQTVVHSGFLEGSTKRVETVLNCFCDLIYRQASAVAVIAPGMVQHVASRGVPEEKIHIVPNWADEDAFRPVEKDAVLAAELGLRRPFTVMYAGIFGRYQKLSVLLETAVKLRERSDIGFALVGGGVEERSLRSRVRDLGLDNVTFVPMQPFDRMATILALGDAQLISLEDLPLFRATLPSKLAATLAAGRPLIGALCGDAAGVVTASGAGVVVTPGSVDEMTNAVSKLADMPKRERTIMGKLGRQYYLSNFSEARVVQKMTALLAAAAHSKGQH